MHQDRAARKVVDYPGKFGVFATLPSPDIDGALKELKYALDILKLDGVSIFTNVAGQYLGDPEFEDLFAELNRRKDLVFVHPTALDQEDELALTVLHRFAELGRDENGAAKVNMLPVSCWMPWPEDSIGVAKKICPT